MGFCFSGSLLRANFNIVFFLFYIVIVRGKYISFSYSSYAGYYPNTSIGLWMCGTQYITT